MTAFDFGRSEVNRIGSSNRRRERSPARDASTQVKGRARMVLEIGTGFLAIVLMMAAAFALRALLAAAYIPQ
jgi:hypothetical protein